VHDLIKTLKEILRHHQRIARFQRVKKDEWTLGSSSTIEILLAKVPAEEIEKAVETNIKSAGDARKEYAETVKNIVENPDTWSTFKHSGDDDE